MAVSDDGVHVPRSLYAEIVSTAAEAVVSIDAEQRIVLFNESAEELFGYTAAEVLGEPLNILIPERFRSAHPQYVRDFAASPVTVHRLGHSSPVPGRRKDGTEFIAEINFSKAEVGGTLYMSATLRDVTARVEVESTREFLAESSRVLVAGLEYGEMADRLARLAVPRLADWCLIDFVVDDGIDRVAVAHRDPEQEPRLRAMRRFAPIEERSVGIAKVIRTGTPELVTEMTDAWLRAATLDEEHYRVLREQAPRSLMIVPLITGRRTLGAVTLATSESGRVYTRSDLALATEFAGLAALHVNNAALYREARESARLRDQVLRIVAHDLRNPLNTIALSMGLIADLLPPDVEPAGRRALEMAQGAVRRADRLIQDLLDAARIEAGRLTLERRSVDTRSLLVEAVRLHQTLAAEKSIELRLDAPAELPAVLADRDRVLQLFENLIGNAIKFTPEGGRVTVAAKPHGEEVVFSVEDTGVGIPEDAIPHLFAPFWRATLEAGRAGAGLGLAISRGIVEAHGGRIWVASAVGVGSTFRFTIPVAKPAGAPRSPGAAAEVARRPRGRRRTP